MKDYINLLFSIIDKIDNWEKLGTNKKIEIIKIYIADGSNYDIYIDYFEKYAKFLRKNTFNNLSKDILTL